MSVFAALDSIPTRYFDLWAVRQGDEQRARVMPAHIAAIHVEQGFQIDLAREREVDRHARGHHAFQGGGRLAANCGFVECARHAEHSAQRLVRLGQC